MGNIEIHAGPTISERDKILLLVTREHENVAWGDIRDIRNTEWHLYLVHWHEPLGLLFVNSSNNSSVHDGLAKAVAGAEAADIVSIGVQGKRLLVDLYHCKYSSGANPGARVGDLYGVCGQAQRSVHWRSDTLGSAICAGERKRAGDPWVQRT